MSCASGAVSEAPDSSRRASSTSSTMSGFPRDRSVTSRSSGADGRSPSCTSISAPTSGWLKGPTSTRPTLRGPLSMASSVARNGCVRVSASGWYVPIRRRGRCPAVRARNATRSRVAASISCRSSRSRTTGRSAASRPRRARSASRVRSVRRSRPPRPGGVDRGHIPGPPRTGAPGAPWRARRDRRRALATASAGAPRARTGQVGRGRRAMREAGRCGGAQRAGPVLRRSAIAARRGAGSRPSRSTRRRGSRRRARRPRP